MHQRTLRIASAILLAAIFTFFTWRGLFAYYTGDDLMNTYQAWVLNAGRLARAQLLIWIPISRPLGGAIYRAMFAAFGFQPRPLYVLSWALLSANAVMAYYFFLETMGRPMLALIGLSLTLVHGSFQDLYFSAGTIYDRLCFLFTVLGIILYLRMRRRRECLTFGNTLLLLLICILAMDSKESGVTLPVLLGCCEIVFVWPGKSWRSRIRAVWPLYLSMAALCIVFVVFRVHRTPELVLTPAYTPHLSIGLWQRGTARYLAMLCYRHAPFSVFQSGVLLCAMAALAIALRNQAMIFGWLFFVVSITPVALISERLGYVLYVPELGLGLFLAGLLGIAIEKASRKVAAAEAIAFAVVTVAVTSLHVHNWPSPPDYHDSPFYRLTTQFQREYPKMPIGANLLFVSDAYLKESFGLLFNLRLLYADPTLQAFRVEAPPDQQPDSLHPVEYDHIFANYSGFYEELDNAHPAESVRLHILKNYSVGHEMDMSRRDHSAYVVSGLQDYDGPEAGRWTDPSATFKFDVYPAPAVYSAKFWVPDFVAARKSPMSISVNGNQIGVVVLSRDGMNEISFPVAANELTRNGFSVVAMNVENPWKDKDGRTYGVMLLRAGFAYR